jgi:hypothetical protein
MCVFHLHTKNPALKKKAPASDKTQRHKNNQENVDVLGRIYGEYPPAVFGAL